MRFQVRAAHAVATTSPAALDRFREGELLARSFEASTPYDAAVYVARTVFKQADALPRRETGWPLEGGLFFTTKLERNTRVDVTPFYLRKIE